MAASYPTSIKTFATHVNITEVIDAAHPNTIQTEVTAIESVLGAGADDPRVSTAVTGASVWDPTSKTYGNVSKRLANIEKGVAGDSHTQYVKNSTVRAKGDLLAGTAASTVTAVAVGVDGQVLVVDSASPAGVKWVDSSTITPGGGDASMPAIFMLMGT